MAESKRSHQAPPPYIVHPSSAHTHTLILLHGLGSTGDTFGREFLENGITSACLSLPQLLPGAKFIFPTARRRRSTAFNRVVLPQWFDKARLDDPSYRKELQVQGLQESARDVLEIIHHELSVEKIAPGNIVLGGLSQGCAMSTSVLLSLDHRIGGFVGMSGYLPFREDIEEALAEIDVEEETDNPFDDGGGDGAPSDPAVKAAIFERDLLGLPVTEAPVLDRTAHGTPVFLGHGSDDDKVPCSLGEDMKSTLEHSGYEVQWRCYQGLGHWYKVPDEINDIVDFIRTEAGWHVAEA